VRVDLQFLYLDPKENPGALDFFGVKPEQCPLLMVHVPNKSAKYVSGTIELDKIESWVADYKAGKIPKQLKSEEPPASNDGPVKVVVSKTFDELVIKSGKNVFIEFYAPWCGHCKKLEPAWTELGETYLSNESIMIAKVDATVNDIDDERFDVQGFPTLYFLSAKGEVSKYEGARSIEELKKFVDEKIGAPTEAADAAKDGEKKDEL
jgi:protein disulfide-isomerase A1